MSNINNAEIQFSTSMEVDELISTLRNDFDDDELYEFVKLINDEVSDVDFTMKLFQYFKREVHLDSDDETEYTFDNDTALGIIKAIVTVADNNPELVDGIRKFIHNITSTNE